MPWREVCPMDEKLLFVASVVADEASMTELCESFGVSRKTGYKWLLRYAEQGLQGLRELPRGPHRAVGDRTARSRGDPEVAPRASELGAQEAARHTRAPRAGAGVARAQYHRRAVAPQRVGARAQTPPPRGPHARSLAPCDRRQRGLVHRLQRVVPYRGS